MVFVGSSMAETSAHSASFTLNGPSRTSSIASRIAVSSTAVASDIDLPVSLPASGTSTAAQSRISASTSYGLSDSSFDFEFDHIRRNTAPYAESEVELYFRPDDDVDYVFSGIYSSLDAVGHPIVLSLILNDLTTSTTLFSSYDASEDSPNEIFTLGQSGGEFSFVSGRPTGTLISGHDYFLHVFAQIEGDPLAATGTVQGTGFVRLAFVPEPSTAWLMGLGLVGFSLGRPGRARRTH